jgi:hypothetical protein
MAVVLMIPEVKSVNLFHTKRLNEIEEKERQSMKDVIRIKPHHFVDIVTSFGAGKIFEPHPYGHAVHTVAERILANRDIPLEIELGADDICAPCKHNISGICDDTIDTSFRPTAPSKKREWNLIIDKRWCERLKLQPGDKLKAKELCGRLRDYSGDITDIYREIPAELTTERACKLKVGIEKFFGEDNAIV